MADSFPLVVTANRLADGVVVYLAADGAWTDLPTVASVVTTPDQQAALLDGARRRGSLAAVIEPTAIPVATQSSVQPVSLRERIRRRGPTVRPDLARA